MWHFHKLTNVDLNLLGRGLTEKASKLVEVSTPKKKKLITDATANLPLPMQAIEAISIHFNENLSSFYKNKNQSVISFN